LVAVNFTNTRNIIGDWQENCSMVYLVSLRICLNLPQFLLSLPYYTDT
jgi:hypothetical protein